MQPVWKNYFVKPITDLVKKFEIAKRHAGMFDIFSTFEVSNFIIIIADLNRWVFNSTPLLVCLLKTKNELLVMFPTFIVRFLIVFPAGVLYEYNTNDLVVCHSCQSSVAVSDRE